MTPSCSLDGKVAVVTGARTGIGKSIALTFAEAGADVAVCSRGDGIEAVVAEIENKGRRGLAVTADVSKKADVEDFVDRVMETFGQIDILVNNAGVIIWEQTFLEATEDDWDLIMDTNLRGTWLCSQAVAKTMLARQTGSIVNMGSIGGGPGVFAGIPIYCVSKAGIRMLTRALAEELASAKIRVNAIEPGWIATDMNARFRPDAEAEAQIASKIPWGRLGVPEDVSRVALFLACDASDYVTGQSILVDGGLFDGTVG
jgi:NAD(P)-dependent dehydrogenase (short-subunit alcohol dehydrogenase family)